MHIFWDAGVEIQPMRLGIRPARRGATITFPLQGPEKLTIARPGDHFADADMLFLFANPIDNSGITAKKQGFVTTGPVLTTRVLMPIPGTRFTLLEAP